MLSLPYEHALGMYCHFLVLNFLEVENMSEEQLALILIWEGNGGTDFCNVNRCSDAPAIGTEQPAKVFYCDSACQKVNWTRHKELCLPLARRKRLYRVGDILQRLFYVYREFAFEKSYEKVESEGNNLYFYEGHYHVDEILVPFPHHLFSMYFWSILSLSLNVQDISRPQSLPTFTRVPNY